VQCIVEPECGKLVHIPHIAGLMAAIAFNLKKLMKFLTKKTNSKVAALHRKHCAFKKSLFVNFINSKISYSDFLTC